MYIKSHATFIYTAQWVVWGENFMNFPNQSLFIKILLLKCLLKHLLVNDLDDLWLISSQKVGIGQFMKNSH